MAYKSKYTGPQVDDGLDKAYTNDTKVKELEGKVQDLENNDDSIDSEPTEAIVENIEPSLVSDALRKSEQHLTEDEKAQVRDNIDAQQELTLTVLDNGNIRIGNLQGQTKDFMPATPSGDPMHYAYESTGAIYNDTDDVIIRKGFFYEGVEHLPKCWYLNYLGDLTNDDMRQVYLKIGFMDSYSTGDAFLYKSRTLIRSDKAYSLTSGSFRGFRNVESLPVSNYTAHSIASNSTINYAFYNGIVQTRIIFPVIHCFENTNFAATCFQTPKLEHIKLRYLQGNVFFNRCPLISKQSILYLINNSGTGKDFVVTLHADAYARLIDDEDIQTALTAHPNVSLASA